MKSDEELRMSPVAYAAGKIGKLVERSLMRPLQGITRRSRTEWYSISVTDGDIALGHVIALFSSRNFGTEGSVEYFVALAKRLLVPVIVIPTQELIRMRAPAKVTLADFEGSYRSTLESIPLLLHAPPQHNECITIGPIFTHVDSLDIITAMHRVSSTGQTRIYVDTIRHDAFMLSILLHFEESGRAQEWLDGWRQKASEVLKEKVVTTFSDN
ncbi:hypothetical protein EWM64_g8036 [Hericium alpestre]|uniref:Uncharacterized protein n=1 Tax=Hericium alpestre TaxID=135208 RepID=A0A4Y9ZM88_9AGAM|nr:hypothetical protein EWM64_g8036 [Hericium alpestre]